MTVNLAMEDLSGSTSAQPIYQGLGKTIKVFHSTRLETADTDQQPINNFKPITSYSWVAAGHPTILVPGCPTLYRGFKAPLKVKRDKGVEIVDKATIFLPDAPLLPLLESIRHTAPDYDFTQHAIIGKRGELKKLLSWSMGDLIRDFRIDLEVGSGGTLLLRRWEPAYLREAGEEALPGMRVPHDRTNFELETCYPVEGNELAIGHARIVSYVSGSDLCGLSLLVQFDVDGFQLQVDSEESAVQVMGPKKKQNTSRKSSVFGGEPSHTHDSKRIFQVLPYDGYEASHEALLELRTRSIKSNFPVQLEDMYKHSIWSSTPTTIVALHAFGTFEREEMYDFADLEECAGGEAVREGVWKVGQLLKELVQKLKSKPVGSKYALLCVLPFERSLVLKEGGCGSGLVENSGA